MVAAKTTSNPVARISVAHPGSCSSAFDFSGAKALDPRLRGDDEQKSARVDSSSRRAEPVQRMTSFAAENRGDGRKNPCADLMAAERLFQLHTSHPKP